MRLKIRTLIYMKFILLIGLIIYFLYGFGENMVRNIDFFTISESIVESSEQAAEAAQAADGPFALFDYAISLGIMGVILYALIKEYKEVRNTLQKVNERYADMLSDTTDALRSATKAVEASNETLTISNENAESIKRLIIEDLQRDKNIIIHQPPAGSSDVNDPPRRQFVGPPKETNQPES